MNDVYRGFEETEELKNCPFYGNKKLRIYYSDECFGTGVEEYKKIYGHRPVTYQVVCDYSNGCATSGRCFTSRKDRDIDGRKQAIEAWNRRVG